MKTAKCNFIFFSGMGVKTDQRISFTLGSIFHSSIRISRELQIAAHHSIQTNPYKVPLYHTAHSSERLVFRPHLHWKNMIGQNKTKLPESKMK